ncbi:hypothetical protein [Rivularia sp. UHCC 0363]|uniref:hypothetical protein n=1 Tax=Rivularia sp. UHCC 0363 TaxID=3110244 RepID=UPI002B1F74AE|nr:hypothetical protein [Rivularia sp. UHCC 0363]MEA5593355.1 hypothetical protein [Rivularia sp. UHCC 0363]
MSTNIIIYLIIFISFKWLQFTPKSDEPHYWQTTLLFSKSLIPDLHLLRNYGELNTPLPFIIFGNLERFFKGGMFAGRILNFILSFLITCIIGLSKYGKYKYSTLAVCGLFLCPYYFRLSSYFYTDIIAIFFALLGFVFYIRSSNIISSIAFVLAIASRQYMLVFPVSIILFELFNVLNQVNISRKNDATYINNNQLPNQSKNSSKSNIFSTRLLMPLIASLSILGWFLLFNGMAPQTGLARTNTPAVQQSLFSVAPESSLYFLACVGLYFVIPELCLFHTRSLFHLNIAIGKPLTLKNCLLAVALLILFIIFPPLQTHGLITNVAKFFPNDFLKLSLYYFLALIATLRFSRIDIAFWILLVNCGLMMKAYPWDKYVLPLLVVFWYLKSINSLHQVTPDGLLALNNHRYRKVNKNAKINDK